MSLILLIDGLVAEDDPAMDTLCPTLDRLAAHGETGKVFLATGERLPEEGGAWFTCFGHALPGKENDLASGFFSALGAGLAPDPSQTWSQLLFTNLFRKQDRLLFLSPQRTGQTGEECRQLAQALQEEFVLEGWGVRTHDSSTMAWCHTHERLHMRTTPLAVLEGQDSYDHLPRGEHQRKLHQLLTTGQLVMARHPLNMARREAGRVPLNTPWLQGVAPGPNIMAQGRATGHCWTQELVVAGLARAAGLHVTLLDEWEAQPAMPWHDILAVAAAGIALVHWRGPAVLARHGMKNERLALLAAMEQSLLHPLVEGMEQQEGELVVISSYPLTRQGHGLNAPGRWLRVMGKALQRQRHFWHRQRFGEGELLDAGAFAARWQ